MPLSRRGFFRKLVNPTSRTREERQERYDLMDQYVRTELLPYQGPLTYDQEVELFAAVRTDLESTGDEELFSAVLRFRVEELVDRKIRAWRDFR
jgi:hypothetical protein